MHITLIGMSNIGKSHWSQRLAAENGFERIACDELIEERLAPELVRRGYSGIHDVARWMGQPYDPQYPETSRKYLACERAVMEKCIARLRAAGERPFIIDTTGSVIYTGDDIAVQLRELTRVVYLEASPAHMERLFERYMKHPKPVPWGDAYVPLANETPQETLKRCYPDFLRGRAARYKQIAHVIIPFEEHHAENANIISLVGG